MVQNVSITDRMVLDYWVSLLDHPLLLPPINISLLFPIALAPPQSLFPSFNTPTSTSPQILWPQDHQKIIYSPPTSSTTLPPFLSHFSISCPSLELGEAVFCVPICVYYLLLTQCMFFEPVLHAVLGGGEYNFTFLKVFLHYNMLTTNKLSDDTNSSSIHKHRYGYQK